MPVNTGTDPAGTGARPTLEATDRLALHELIAEHWSRTDRVIDASAADLYLDDGEMEIGRLAKHGIGEIRDYFAQRRGQEDASGRRTRHAISNIVVERADEAGVRLRFLAVVFAGAGSIPFASTPPTTIADFAADCRRDAHGHWKFWRMQATVVFVGAGAPSFAN